MAKIVSIPERDLHHMPMALKNRMMWIKADAFDLMIAQGRFVPATVEQVMTIMQGTKIGRHPVTGVLYHFVYKSAAQLS